MLFTTNTRSLALSAVLVAATFITLTSAAPHPSGTKLKTRGIETDDASRPRPPANPDNLTNGDLGVTGLWHLSYNADPLTSSFSAMNFDISQFGGAHLSGWGGYCNIKDDVGCLFAAQHGGDRVSSYMYKCTEIDSRDSGKKALVWRKFKECGSGRNAYQTCWRGSGEGICH